MKKVLITGGAGYVGTLLSEQLANKGYQVVVYDMLHFGCHIAPHENISIIKADIRDKKSFSEACQGVDIVLHLACISNDPSFELDEKISQSINYDCFEPLVITAKNAGVKQFVYASSSSVYGVSAQKNVTEDHPLLPLTLYNKFKGMCEPLLFKHQADDFVCTTIRPATICGYSPRMRFDLSVNILTNHAVNNNKITVFGGDQLRPNLHVQDMCDLYELLLTVPQEKIAGQTFNVGYQNQSILELASIVKKIVQEEFPEKGEIEIVQTPSDDNRSYHINSDKIKNIIGFSANYTSEDSVRGLCKAFKENKFVDPLNNLEYFNVRTLKQNKAA